MAPTCTTALLPQTAALPQPVGAVLPLQHVVIAMFARKRPPRA